MGEASGVCLERLYINEDFWAPFSAGRPDSMNALPEQNSPKITGQHR